MGGKKKTWEEAIDIQDCYIHRWQEGLGKGSFSFPGTVDAVGPQGSSPPSPLEKPISCLAPCVHTASHSQRGFYQRVCVVSNPS